MRDLVRGLYDGDGGPAAKGIVYVVGVGQNGFVPTYKAIESWLQDAAFWNDMASYVSGFYQESTATRATTPSPASTPPRGRRS